MKISRCGSGANHGFKSIEMSSPSFSWNDKEQVIEIRHYSIRDFTSGSTHDYIFKIPLSELMSMIKIVGGEPANNKSELLSEAFSPCLREIIRLQKCCVGEIGNANNA